LPYTALLLGAATAARGADPGPPQSVPLAAPVSAPSISPAVIVPDAGQWSFEGQPHIDLKEDVLFFDHGVVGRRGDKLLIADAARVSIHDRDEIFAAGHVILVQPGVRIAAHELGYRFDNSTHLGSGEAWDVDITIMSQNRTVRAHAAHLTIDPRLITLDGVTAEFGYGGILSVTAPTIRVYLPEHTMSRPTMGGTEHDQIRNNIDAISIVNPTVRILAVPCLYFPYLYRNFTWDEPWTRVEFGDAKRLGTYLHSWIGTNLGEFDGWQTRIEARVDTNSRSGWGFGLNGFWRNDTWGQGDIKYFEMPKETVAGGNLDDDDLAVRKATLVDAEHQINFGRGAFYARYVQEPAPDPVEAGETPPLNGGDERFRSDYFPTELDHEPFAEKGAGLAYGLSWGTFVVDDYHNPRPEWTQTQRFLGLHLETTPLQLAGPVHLEFAGWEENLQRIDDGTSANRFNGVLSATGLEWLGGSGVGIDATAGVHALRYDDGVLQGIEQPDAGRGVAFLDAGVRLRLEDDAPTWMHVVTPRIGVQLTSPGTGDALPGYGFGDDLDTLTEDQCYYTLGLDTAYTNGPRQIRAEVVSRFAMREQDRVFIDPLTGYTSTGHSRFADIAATVEGQLGPVLTLNGTATYDDRPQRFTNLNAGISLRVSPHLVLSESVALVTSQVGQPVSPPDLFSNEPSFTYFAGRYRCDGSATMVPGGKPIDNYFAQLGREMVDGELTLSYGLDYGPTGQLYDQRFSIGFSLFATHAGDPGVAGRGATYTAH